MCAIGTRNRDYFDPLATFQMTHPPSLSRVSDELASLALDCAYVGCEEELVRKHGLPEKQNEWSSEEKVCSDGLLWCT